MLNKNRFPLIYFFLILLNTRKYRKLSLQNVLYQNKQSASQKCRDQNGIFAHII